MAYIRKSREAGRIRSFERAGTVAFTISAGICVTCGVIFDNVAWAVAGLAPLIIDNAFNGLRVLFDQRERFDAAQKQIGQTDAVMRELEHKLDMIQQAVGITVLGSVEDTYEYARRTLLDARDSGGWQKVRLYAPVGAQDNGKTKAPWLATLAEELGSSVDNVSAVVGLPADGDVFREVACSLFMMFANTPGTDVHYIPPDNSGKQPPTPGIGIAIFENRKRDQWRVIFAFAGPYTGHGEQTVSSGFSIDGGPIGPLMADWFDSRPFKYTSKFVLRGDDPDHPSSEVVLADQLRRIRDSHYKGLTLDLP